MESTADKLLFILPAFEPPAQLVELVRTLRANCPYPILIVNDGSTPEKQMIFTQLAGFDNCTVLVHPQNQGKGRALKTAFHYALTHYPHLTGAITADVDGQHSATDILRCANALMQHPEHLILGVRNFRSQQVPWKSRWGNYLMTGLFRRLRHINLSDTQTGLRAVPARLMKIMLNQPGERFEFETLMLLTSTDAASAGTCPIMEIPIATIYNSGNRSSHFRCLRDSWQIIRICYRTSPGGLANFAASGMLSAILDQGLFALLFYYVLPGTIVPPLPGAVVIARVAALICNYMLNRNAVFKSGKNHFDIRTFTGYIFLCLLIMLSSYGLLELCRNNLPSANTLFCKLLIDTLLFAVSYYFQKQIIFRASPPKNPPPGTSPRLTAPTHDKL